ncbi:hypothetical protein A2U01_0064697, partial [Trifolium medium]|nr:hypothetical protein [Trifolium medium]
KETEGSSGGREGNSNGGTKHQKETGGGDDDPWRVVQKQRRNKKANPGRNNTTAAINDTPAKINEHASASGSRFASLMDDVPELEKEGLDNTEILTETDMEEERNMGGSQNMQ